MEELGSDHQREPILDDWNFILNECTIKFVRKLVWSDDHGGNDLGCIARTEPCSQAPDEILPSRQWEMMEEIDVKRIASFSQVDIFAVSSVVISLHLNVRSGRQVAAPTTQQIASRKFGILLHVGHRGRRIARDSHSLSGNAFIEVALNRQCVALAQVPIRPETALTDSPIVEFPAIGMKLGTASEAFTVDSIVDILVLVSRSKAKVDKALIDISAANGNERSMGVF